MPYVWTTAAVYRLSPDHPERMLLVQTLFAIATTLVVAHLAQRLAGPRAGLLSGVIVALHPALAYYDVRKLHPLGLDTLLTTSCLAVMLAAAKGGAGRAAFAGAVFGLALLQRGSLLPFAALAVLWLVYQLPSRARLVSVALFCGTMLAVLSPWLIRNATLFGKPVFVTGNSYRFFIGNAPHSQGAARLSSGAAVLDAAGSEIREKLRGRAELEHDRVFADENRTLVRNDPGRFLAGIAKKYLYFWTWSPAAGVLYARSYKIIYLIFYGALVLAAVKGAAALFPSNARPALLLMLGLFLSVSAVHAVYYVEMRHRWALEPLLCILAAAGVVGAPPRAAE